MLSLVCVFERVWVWGTSGSLRLSKGLLGRWFVFEWRERAVGGWRGGGGAVMRCFICRDFDGDGRLWWDVCDTLWYDWFWGGSWLTVFLCV